MTKKIIQTPNAPAAVGTYSQGIELNGVFYFSGQIGLDPKNMNLQTGFKAQLDQILKNVDGLLESQGLNRTNIFKTTIFMTDLAKFGDLNTAYELYFKAPYPARSTVQVSALPKGAEIEIEVMAAK
jgi:2-iminobutanoate/2-iminopropanoate deaminase